MKSMRKYLFIFLGVICIAPLGYYLYLFVLPNMLTLLSDGVNQGQFPQDIPTPGVRTALVLVALTALLAAIPLLPTSVLAVAVGVAYGPVFGSLINLTGSVLGNLLAVSIIRRFDTVDPENQENRWVASITGMRRPKIGIVLGYMIPIIPSFLINYTVGLLKLRNGELLPLLIIGMVPTSVLYAMGGDAVSQGDFLRAILTILSVLLLVLLAGFITRKRKHVGVPEIAAV